MYQVEWFECDRFPLMYSSSTMNVDWLPPGSGMITVGQWNRTFELISKSFDIPNTLTHSWFTRKTKLPSQTSCSAFDFRFFFLYQIFTLFSISQNTRKHHKRFPYSQYRILFWLNGPWRCAFWSVDEMVAVVLVLRYQQCTMIAQKKQMCNEICCLERHPHIDFWPQVLSQFQRLWIMWLIWNPYDQPLGRWHRDPMQT